MRSTSLSVMVIAIAALALAGCTEKKTDVGGGAASEKSAKAESVLCLGAASAKDALKDLGETFQRSTGIVVKFSPEDSSKLANQIVEGAPAHVFLSANQKWADFVSGKGFAEESTALLGNSLVLVVPKGNAAQVKTPADLGKPSVKHVAVAGPTVPAGIYARAALTSLKLWDDLATQKKLTPGENVRSALAYVERGEAEAGIVYATDAKITDKVEVVATFDPASHPKVVYPLVLLKKGAANPNAKRWYEFLQTKEAAAVFEKHGFTSLVGG